MTSYTNTSPPTITGNRVVGGTLNATVGTWSPTPASFTYQWERADDNAGLNDTPIAGATGATYTIDPTDSNKFLRVGVYPGAVASVIPTIAIPGSATFRYGGAANEGPQSELPLYATVDLAAYRTSDLLYAKANSPTTRVLCYKDPSVCEDNGTNPTINSFPSAISYQEALAHDTIELAHGLPRDLWLLRDGSGVPVWDTVFVSPKDYLANMGSLTYQAQALANILATIQATTPDWDGVWFDNIQKNYITPHHLSTRPTAAFATPPGGGTPASLSDADYQTNMIAFLAAINAGLGSYYIAVNSGVSGDDNGSQTAAWWPLIAPYVDGFWQEYFSQEPDGILTYNPPGDYHANHDAQMNNLMDTANSLGKDFTCIGHGTVTDLAKMMYIRATFMLKWNGGAGSAFLWKQSNGTTPYHDSVTLWLGYPTAAMFAVSTGWRRNYDLGTVILNPNAATGASITFSLGGTYYKPDGSTASSVTLAPTTAMILTTYAH